MQPEVTHGRQQEETCAGRRPHRYLNEDYEVRYWTEKWGISKEELQRAVIKVGSRTDAIARHLGKQP